LAAQGSNDRTERVNPRPLADERLRSEGETRQQFYEAMRELSEFSKSVNQLAAKASQPNTSMLHQEVKRWHEFQADIESVFLRPDKSNLKWQ